MQRPATSSSTDGNDHYGPAGGRLSATGVLAIAAVHVGLLALLASFDVLPRPVPVNTVMVQAVSLAAPARPEIAAPQPKPVEPKPIPHRKARTEAPAVAQQTAPAITDASTAASTVPNAVAEDATPVTPPSPPATVAAKPSVTEESRAQAAPPALSAPRFDASYLQNPAPAYPEQSRRFGEWGTVVLRVFVEPTGRPSRIEVKTGSGSPRLDLAAQDAVARWQFVAARLGAEKVGAWVLVPIVFNLKG